MTMTADEDVEVATEADLRKAVAMALRRLNMSFDELEEEAASGEFRSELARRTWFTFSRIGHLSR